MQGGEVRTITEVAAREAEEAIGKTIKAAIIIISSHSFNKKLLKMAKIMLNKSPVSITKLKILIKRVSLAISAEASESQMNLKSNNSINTSLKLYSPHLKKLKLHLQGRTDMFIRSRLNRQ